MAKSLKVEDLAALLGQLVPLRYAEPWDNVGLLAGDPDQEIQSVLLTIDLTLAVVDEALEKGCQMVLCYHPPIFEGLKRIPTNTPVGRALSSGIALYSIHTAFDAVVGGVNDALAAGLGLCQVEPLRPFFKGVSPKETSGLAQVQEATDHRVGMGRVGILNPGQDVDEFLGQIKRAFQIPHLLVAGAFSSNKKLIRKVGVAAGAGGDLLKTALACGVDAFVTGEVRHHDALQSVASGTILVCLRHSSSERHALKPLKALLETHCPLLSFEISQKDTDPFEFY
jgi:dinuclear metal center YbgI/SA1388 family protein